MAGMVDSTVAAGAADSTLERDYHAHRSAHGCGLQAPAAGPARELEVLLRATRARYVLELGTGLGHQALLIAGAFGQTGRLDTVEPDGVHAGVASGHFRRSAIGDRIRLHTASAGEVLPALNGPYDFVVLAPGTADAALIEDLHRLLRSGGTLLAQAGPGGAEAAGFAEQLAGDGRFLVAGDESGRILAVKLG